MGRRRYNKIIEMEEAILQRVKNSITTITRLFEHALDGRS